MDPEQEELCNLAMDQYVNITDLLAEKKEELRNTPESQISRRIVLRRHIRQMEDLIEEFETGVFRRRCFNKENFCPNKPAQVRLPTRAGSGGEPSQGREGASRLAR